MSYWDKKQAGRSNLRLLEQGAGWRKHDDDKDEEGKVTFPGASRAVETTLTTALSATNLIILTGAGSSFCAKNPDGVISPPSLLDLWNAVEAKATKATMDEVIALIPNASSAGTNIEKLLTLSKLYVALFAKPKAANSGSDDTDKIIKFIDTAEQAISKRVDFVSEKTDLSAHKELIRKVARRGARKLRAKVFTTNYDLCFERSAQQQQFVAIDGFSHSLPQIYDRAHYSYDIVRRGDPAGAPNYIDNVFHLYKLHGSLDWRRSAQGIVRSVSDTDGAPVLIYPRDTKYQESFEAPFLDMMSALLDALREPDSTLIVSGFGFNDDHIGKPIIAALEANMTLRLVVCDIAFLSDEAMDDNAGVLDKNAAPRTENSYFRRLQHLVELGDRRVTLLNGRFEDLVHALPDLVAETERERHAERLRTLRGILNDGAGDASA